MTAASTCNMGKWDRAPRILLVDDDPSELKLYSNLLNECDCQLKTAGSVQGAMSILQDFHPDIILSDVIMPDENGFEFCRKIKGDPARSRIIFILISGSTELENSLKGFEAGADDYLHKPFGKKELHAKLAAFLKIKMLQNDLARTNLELNQTLEDLKNAKIQLEEKNAALVEEKAMIENSLKQISLMASERDKTNRELERLNQIQHDNIRGLIALLSSFIESKRQYHRGHSKKVADIASFMAKALELPEESVRDIETAALLHELGKLTIPDDLAMKNPKDYTSEEKDFLSQHPVQAAAMLDQFSGFKEVAKIIRHFHEHFDGSGNPDGLEGNSIPIGSRIVAVANLFENMAYRQKQTETRQIFEAIEECMGSMLDPALGPLVHQYAMRHPLDEEINIQELRLLELEPGMELAGGIFTQGGTKLLPVGSKLTEASIRQVLQYSKLEPIVETVYIKS